MRSLVLLLLTSVPLLGQGHWERIFPNTYPVVEDMVLLSVGVRPYGDGRLEHLIGSRDGYVLSNYSLGDADGWRPRLKLGISFDITAIHYANERYWVGGPRGQIAKSVPVPNSTPLFNLEVLSLEQLWSVSSLPTDETVRSIRILGEAVLVLAGKDLFNSLDGGHSWEPFVGSGEILSLETYDNAANLLERIPSDSGIQLYLKQSEDAINWSTVWAIKLDGPWIHPVHANLFKLTDAYDKFSQPVLDEERLFVIFDGWRGPKDGPSTHYELLLSKRKVGFWYDHGSTLTGYIQKWIAGGIHSPPYPLLKVSVLEPWNPLNLPKERMGFRPPGRRSGLFAANYRIEENLLEAYTESEWVSLFTTDPSPKIQPSLVTQDEILTYIYGDSEVLVHLPDGSIDGIYLPEEFTGPNMSWTGWIQLGNRYYGLAGGRLVSTQDFISWEAHFDAPRGGVLMGGEAFPSVAVASHQTFNILNEQRPIYYAIRTLRDAATPDGLMYDQILLPDNISSVTYVPQANAFFALWINAPFQYPVEERTVVIERILEDGSAETFATFVPESWNGYFDTLACPDGEMLIAFGDSAELAVMDPDGDVQLAHPWRFFPPDDYRISNITYAAGWYYILGGAVLRTRDFEEFERVDLPVGDKFISISEWENNLYGFSEGAVYQLSTEFRYLDALPVAADWLENDWLGRSRLLTRIRERSLIYNWAPAG